MTVDKFIGKFHVIGHVYSLSTPGSAEITQRISDKFIEVSVYDKTSYGIVLTVKDYDINGNFESLKIGQIVEVKNQKGKIISKYIQFPDEKDNGVSSWYISKLNKKGYVTQYVGYNIEAGFNIDTVGESTLGVVNPNQKPTIGQRNITRVKKFPWKQR